MYPLRGRSPCKHHLLSCSLLPSRGRHGSKPMKPSSSQPISPLPENTKDVDLTSLLHSPHNTSMDNISIHQTQMSTTFSMEQQTNTSLSLHVNSSSISHVLSLLTDGHIALKRLEFHGVDFEPEALRRVATISTSEVLFESSSFGERGMVEVIEVLGRNASIVKVIFFACRIGSTGATHLASGLKRNRTLKELQIWEDSIGPRAAEELAKMVEVNPTLTHLTLADRTANSTTAAAVVSSAVAGNREVEVDVLGGGEGRWSKAAEVRRGLLRGYKLSSAGARRTCVALGYNTTVRTLDLTGIRLNSRWAAEFRRVLETNRTLKEAVLAKTGLRDKAIVYVAAGLFGNTSLESLRLEGNPFGGVGVEHLLCPLTRFGEGVEQGNRTLRSLVVGGRIGIGMGIGIGIGRVGVEAIVRMLERNESIVSLGIHEDDSIRGGDVIRVFRSLERNLTLRRLSLRGCRGVEGQIVLEAIMTSLEINTWIEEVDLSGTPLEVGGRTQGLYRKLRRRRRHLRGEHAISMEEEDDDDDDEEPHALPLTLAEPNTCRIFFCGRDFAGKTTLANSLSSDFSSEKLPFWNEIRLAVGTADFTSKTPQVKIKTLRDNNPRISFLILPGEQEFHSLHKLLFPESGSPCLFLIICSLLESDNKQMRSLDVIEEDLLYWLRFHVSNSRRSQPQYLLPNVTIVLTHFDRISHESEKLQAIVKSVDKLRDKFEEFVDFYPTVFAVDCRSSASVIKLANHVRNASKIIRERVPQTYKVCDDLIKALKSWRSGNHDKPLMRWKEFCHLCQVGIPSLRIRRRCGEDEIDSRRIAVAKSLHSLGEVIFFEGLGLLVLDVEWLCNDVIIHLIKLDASKRNCGDKNGFISKQVLEKILQGRLHGQIPGMGPRVLDNLEASELMWMMLKLELCFQQNPGNPESLLLIPMILEEDRGQVQKWPLSSMDCIHVGRRMECDESSHMFMSAGFFPRLQMHLYNKLCIPKNPYTVSYSLKRYLISITINGICVRIELGGQLGCYIDILGCASKSTSEILRLFHKLIVPAIHELCHEVCLMESIIRPDCVKYLIPPRFRKNQIIPVQKLKLILLSLPAESFQDHQQAWSPISEGAKPILQAGFDHATDLLSHEEMREVLHRRYYDLHHLATQLAVRVDNQEQLQNKASETEADSPVDPSLLGIAKGMEAVLRRLKIIESEIKDIKQEIQSLGYYEHRLLVELYRRVDYLVNFNIQMEERKFPQMFYFVQIENNLRRLVTRIVPGMLVLRLHMLCEYRGEMHVVEDQLGCELMQVDNSTVKCLLPYMTKFMKLLTFALKIGAHLAVGMGELIPDLSREIAHLASSPSVMGGAAAMAAGAAGASAVGQLVGGRQRNRGLSANPESSGSTGPDVIAARQWLIDFLKDQHITSGKDIAERFGLWRVRYRDNGQIAWICRRHGQLRAVKSSKHLFEYVPT